MRFEVTDSRTPEERGSRKGDPTIEERVRTILAEEANKTLERIIAGEGGEPHGTPEANDVPALDPERLLHSFAHLLQGVGLAGTSHSEKRSAGGGALDELASSLRAALAEDGDPDDILTKTQGLNAAASGQIHLASLSLIEVTTLAAQVAERDRDPLSAYANYAKACSKLDEIVPADHELALYLIKHRERLAETSEVAALINNTEGPVRGKPQLTITDNGFEVELRLPSDLIEDGQIPDGEEVVAYLLEAGRAAEKARSQHGGPNAHHHDSSISDHSISNSIAKKGPKIYDPTGKYRGRLSSNTIGKESILNSIGDYGSDIRYSSLHRQLSSPGNANTALHMTYGTWKIVSDLT